MSNRPQLRPTGKVAPSVALWVLGASLFLAILLIFVFRTNQGMADCNYPYPGDTGTISLASGDSLCIPAGSNFTGDINSFPAGSKITVEPGASFSPGMSFGFRGTLLNNGEVILFDVILETGFTLINNDTLSVDGYATVGGDIALINNEEGRLNFLSPLNFAGNSVLENKGIIYVGSDIALGASTSFTNNGYLIGIRSIDVAGQLQNYGLISTVGPITLTGSGAMQNNCSLISIEGFVNDNPNTENAGVILVQGSNGFPNDLIEINEPFLNQSQGYLAGVRFINNSTITGAGNYYFAGQTENNGPFGNDGAGINFYDASSSTGIMDVENTTPDGTVFRDAAQIPDSFYVPTGCDVAFLASFLPVEWQDMSVAYDNGAGLIRWSTTQEVNHDYFEVERSWDGKSFESISQVQDPKSQEGNTKSYQYTDYDIAAGSNPYIYYRIRQVDIDGNFSLSQIMSLTMDAQLQSLTFFTANPVIDGKLSLTISSDRPLEGKVSLLDLNGRAVYQRSIDINRGKNSRVIGLVDTPSGMYVVELFAGGKKLTKKVLVHQY